MTAVLIRPATPDDAVQAAPLLCAAWGSLGPALTGAGDADEVQKIVAGLVATPGNRVSYQNALVAESDAQVVGVAVCYHGAEAEALDRPLTALLVARTGDPTATIPVEATPDEFYLDTLSVRPDFQGRGIGRELLAAFERRALERGCRTLGLLVEGDNEAARRLYAKTGYVTVGTRLFAGSEYDHQVKTVSASVG